MKTLKEFTESVINPNWTHKLPFGDLKLKNYIQKQLLVININIMLN